MANINRKATKKDKQKAINELKKSNPQHRFTKGTLSKADVHLVLEYVAQGGNLVRPTKTKKQAAEAHARALLKKRAKISDALHVITPAVNTLQNEYTSAQKGINILLQVLLDHGYTQKDLDKAGTKVNIAYKRGVEHEIHTLEKRYTSKHQGSKPKKSNKHTKVVKLNSKGARHAASKIRRARNKKAGKE